MMRLPFIRLFAALFMFVALSGCNHIELPFFDHAAPGEGNSTSTVDVNGVGDGVTSERVVIKRIAFPADEYARLKASGSSTVKGVIAVTYNGHQILGKETRLYLNPVTSYSRQWYRESYLGGHKMGKSDPKLFNYIKFTSSNVNGQFAFYGVPAGSYYVVGTIHCTSCGGRNIRIARKITVNGSNVATVDLSKSL